MALGPAGVIYMAGTVASALVPGNYAGSLDIFAQARRLDGTVLWTKQVGTSGSDEVFAAASASDGTFYVGGTTTGAFPGAFSGAGRDNLLLTIRP